MTLYPTKATFHVAVAGAAMVAVGIAARAASIVTFGAGIVLVLAASRVVALLLVTRLRAAGFDLKLVAPRRLVQVAVGTEVEIELEIRNWGTGSVRATNLRAIASSMLEAVMEPRVIELPAATSTRVRLRVRGDRVGRWGIHGLALEVRGALARSDGSYEVPLIFHSPFGVEVLPRPLAALIQSPRGGRARRMGDATRASRLAGEGDELRELREHVPGDPFKRIAWKASARRGELLVRETDRSEREVVWLILDASVELWAGALGHAPLDRSVEQVATVAARHLARGDQVGLYVVASRVRAALAPDAGAPHAGRVAAALLGASVMVDEDRSELDDREVAMRVLDHAQSTDPSAGVWLVRGDLAGLARRVDELRGEAPFSPPLPYATTPHGAVLRRYLAAFGIETPPRIEGERERTDVTIAATLEKIAGGRERPSMVYVWAPAPVRKELLARVIPRLRVRKITLAWTLPAIEDSVGSRESSGGRKSRALQVREVIDEAVRMRAHVEQVRGTELLRRMGAKVAPLPNAPHPRRRLMAGDDA
jgi:uncharacterized protein (DUF58 family)